MILLDLNTADGRPIYGQIADRVKFAVAAGVLAAGGPGALGPRAVEATGGQPEHGGPGVPRAAGRGAARAGAGDGLAGGRGGGRAVPAGAAGVRPRPAPRRRSRRRGGAGWTRPRSRRSSARSGPGATVPAEPRRTGGTGDDEPGEEPAIRIENLTKRYRDQVGRRRALAGGARGLGLRPPGRERGGQDDDDPDPARPDRRRQRAGRGARAGPVAAGAGGPPPGGLRARAAPALYDWMTVAEIGWFAAGFHPDGRTGAAALPDPLRRAGRGLRPAGQAEDQGPVEGDAGQGLAGAGAGLGPGAPDPRRADLGPRRDGPPRVPREHGRPRRRGADGPPLQPPDRARSSASPATSPCCTGAS